MALSPGTLTVMLDAAWRVTLVLAVAWAATRVLGRRPAALRHAVWATALAAALAVPALSGIIPSWRVAILPASPSAAAVVFDDSVVPGATTGRVAQARAPLAPTLAAAPPRPGTTTPQSMATAADRPARSAADWLGLLWASLAAMILGRYGASLASVRWLTRSAEPVTDRRWRDAGDVAAAELGLAESPTVLSSDQVAVPFTSGVLRPVVVVPSCALTTWSDERIRVVLLHELAHVRRRDCLVQALTQVACAAYWFNPLTWVAARRLRAERERACDDLVLEAGMRGADYAQHLLDIARTASPRRSLSVAALAMARPSELEGRLLAILDGHRARRMAGAPLSWRMIAFLIAVAVPVASMQPVAREALGAPELDVRADQVAPTPIPTPTPTPTPAPGAAVRVARPVAAGSSITLTAHDARHISAVASGVVGALVAQTGQVASEVVSAVASGASEGVVEGLRQIGLGQPSNAPGAKRPTAERQTRPVSPAVIQGLTEAMKDSDADVRKQALQALARLGAPVAYDVLIAALKDEDADMRQQAAFSLGQLRDARSIDPLTAALKDSEPDVRQQAAFALSQLKAVQAVPALQAALKDADEDVRQQALFALSQIGDRSSLPAMVEALKDSSEEVREQALFAISQLGDASAVPAILPLLSKDDSEDVRQQAAFALSQIGDDSAVAALTAAIKDPSPDVRRQAIFALSQIADGDSDRDRKPRSRGWKTPAAAPAQPPQKPQ